MMVSLNKLVSSYFSTDNKDFKKKKCLSLSTRDSQIQRSKNGVTHFHFLLGKGKPSSPSNRTVPVFKNRYKSESHANFKHKLHTLTQLTLILFDIYLLKRCRRRRLLLRLYLLPHLTIQKPGRLCFPSWQTRKRKPANTWQKNYSKKKKSIPPSASWTERG